MYIFIDTISQKWKIIAHKNFKIIKEKNLNVLGSEYSDFLDIFLEFLKEIELDVADIEWVTVVNWPGWFTGTRIIALVINTIQFVNHIKVDAIDYFSLIEKAWSSYPMIIKANRTEFLYKENSGSKPYIMPKSELKPWKYSGIWNELDFENKDIWIESKIDYVSFIEKFEFSWTLDRIEPYYIKKPNIT
jgi:tRNA A37 threonylcarbamoyladenosine modification protein TsaB